MNDLRKTEVIDSIEEDMLRYVARFTRKSEKSLCQFV